jgi:hypothetical protein
MGKMEKKKKTTMKKTPFQLMLQRVILQETKELNHRS